MSSAGSGRLTAHCSLLTALLLTAHCLLLTAYCPLLAVFRRRHAAPKVWPYQPSMMLMAVTARLFVSCDGRQIPFLNRLSDASVKFGLALYQSKLAKYFCVH